VKPLKEVLITLGHVFMFSWSLVIIWIFLLAYVSADKAVTIFINLFGEAHLEFVLVLVVFPIMAYTMVSYVVDVVIRPIRAKRAMRKIGIDVVRTA